MPDTHVVANQVPPLQDYNAAHVAGTCRGADPRRGSVGPGPGERARSDQRQPGSPALGRARRPQSARPAYPRPLRAPRRRGGIRPGLSRADAHGYSPWTARGTVGRRAAGCARGAGGVDLGVDRRARSCLSDLDDVCRRSGAALQPRAGGGLRAVADQPRLRPGAQAGHHQARHHRGHVDDREAGRLRRARRYHPGDPATPTAPTA